MPMDMRIESSRAAVQKLHYFDPDEVLTNQTVVPSSCVEFRLPGDEHAVAQPVLQRLKLVCQFGVKKCGDAVGLWMIEGAIEHKVGVSTQMSIRASEGR
ncbi:MAG: hypothetical protein ABS62_11140 [Microbacterium sp. SCN 70-200]|nr:MAG: hypothetical protein ABS62_11140 [Microbacterium sp. SCN 70-200]OJV79267.1 MAG: hypothetical protein BGO46_03145 [Microbacterium sp. 70-16]